MDLQPWRRLSRKERFRERFLRVIQGQTRRRRSRCFTGDERSGECRKGGRSPPLSPALSKGPSCGAPGSPVTSDSEWLRRWGKGSKAENSTRQERVGISISPSVTWEPPCAVVDSGSKGNPLQCRRWERGLRGPETETPPGSSAPLRSSRSRPQWLPALSLKLRDRKK